MMTKNYSRTLTILMAFLSVTLGAAAQETKVWGWVVDAQTGQPLAGHVSIAHTALPNVEFFDARADSTGFFEMGGLQPGEKILIARAEGYGFAWKKVTVGAGETLGSIDFALEKAAMLEGQVADELGQPVEGATVELAYKDLPPVMFDYMPGWAETDSTGTYRLRDVTPSRDFYIEIAHPRFSPGLGGTSLRAQPGETVQVPSMTLTLGITLRGQVQDAEGKPLPEVEIRLVARRMSRRLPAGYRGTGMIKHRVTQTDDNGRFSIEGMAEGKFRLLARHQQFRPFHQMVELDWTVAHGVSLDIQLQPKGQ